jgi:hypothetical protein
MALWGSPSVTAQSTHGAVRALLKQGWRPSKARHDEPPGLLEREVDRRAGPFSGLPDGQPAGRSGRYEAAMAKGARHPKDAEVTAFYALPAPRAVDLTDKTLHEAAESGRSQTAAAGIPITPGCPAPDPRVGAPGAAGGARGASMPLARQRRALHMPSRLLRRSGMWPETIRATSPPTRPRAPTSPAPIPRQRRASAIAGRHALDFLTSLPPARGRRRTSSARHPRRAQLDRGIRPRRRSRRTARHPRPLPLSAARAEAAALAP